MNVIIYGAGGFGRYVAEQILSNKNFSLLGFIDNEKNKMGGAFSYNLPIIDLDSFKQFFVNKIDAVIIAVANEEISQEMTLSLLPWCNKSIYIVDKCVWGGKFNIFSDDMAEFNVFVREYRSIKPVLGYIEYDVTDFCNLKCKNCGHNADHVQDMHISDIDIYKLSIEGLAKKFKNINRIRLMGGEPLLVKNLNDYIEYARQFFPRADICIVTNGLLIPKIDKRIKQAIFKNGVRVQITQYPPTRNVIREIYESLEEENIVFEIGEKVEFFYKREDNIIPSPYPIDVIWQNCIGRVCHTLKDGKVAACGTVLRMSENLNDENIIDVINGSEDGWKILQIIERPFDYCGNCSIEKLKVPWEAS